MEEALGDGLDRLDPVCLMDVDPATERHTTEYAGRIIAFCAPSRKKPVSGGSVGLPERLTSTSRNWIKAWHTPLTHQVLALTLPR